MPAVIPVKYYTSPTARDGGFVYVFQAVGPGAAHLNGYIGGLAIWGEGERPVRARYFAGKDWYGFRSDCAADARRFGAQHGVRTRILCLPMPVKSRFAWFPRQIIRMREQQERRRAVTTRWMLAAGVQQEAAELIALHLVGHKLSDAELAARAARVGEWHSWAMDRIQVGGGRVV